MNYDLYIYIYIYIYVYIYIYFFRVVKWHLWLLYIAGSTRACLGYRLQWHPLGSKSCLHHLRCVITGKLLKSLNPTSLIESRDTPEMIHSQVRAHRPASVPRSLCLFLPFVWSVETMTLGYGCRPTSQDSCGKQGSSVKSLCICCALTPSAGILPVHVGRSGIR